MDKNLFITSGWNVIEEKEFKGRVMDVFEKVSTTLTKSLGPYGKTTIIEKHGNYHITKDGWSVLKNIKFSNPIDNNIMQMIYEIAAQVVVKVGDGSTSAIVSANEILKLMEKDSLVNEIRAKDFIDVLNECVNIISNEIILSASQIKKEGDCEFSEIYDLALISTNGNDKIAKIIQTIYRKTKNPTIDYISSKTNRTHHEIIEGYKLQFMTYLDRIFVTSDDGNCIIENPLLLMLDFKFEYNDIIKKIFTYSQMIAKEKNKKLVIVAPYYDKMSLDIIRRSVNEELRQSGETSIVYSKVSLINNMYETLYSDFAAMAGGCLLTESDFLDAQPDDDILKLVEKSVGEVSNIVIGKDHSTISGLGKRNENMYRILLRDATANYNNQLKKDASRNIISTDTFELKKRLAKLNCKMGVIYIGGMSELSKESNKDLVEDAIKACETAYNYGYNLGCNMAILTAINDIVKSDMFEHMDDTYKKILELLAYSFKEVYSKVIANKFVKDADGQLWDRDKQAIEEIIEGSFDSGLCYDLITSKYSDKIINPCYTDIEILKASTSIIALIISSNQYISIIIKEAN